MAKLLYSTLAQYYELIINRDYRKETEYLIEIINEHSKGSTSIIDLGCGIGMHIKYLSEKGYATTGLDLSENMIFQSFRNSPSSDYINADFKKFSLKRKKDVAICMGTSFNYLLTDDEFNKFAEAVHKNINSILVLDTKNFLNPANLKEIENDHLIYENELVRFDSTRSIRFNNGCRIMDFHHKILHKQIDKVDEYYDESVGRLFTLEMINKLLEGKFQLIEANGNYHVGMKFNQNSERLLAIYKKI